MGTKTFWVELLPDRREWHYTCRAQGPCPVHGEEHTASSEPVICIRADSPGWDAAPKTCACGYAFTKDDSRVGHGKPFWRRRDTGEVIKGKLPPGALYVNEPMKRQDGWEYKGADGLNVVCVLPNGNHWWIDSRASNCTKKDDIVHRCWVRHGTLDGMVHVDKNGNTCAAGGGSIVSGNYHGFLHQGVLT